MKKLGIYIHIPFCKQKCFYCDFVSYANQDKYFQKYVQALNKEINNFIDNNEFEVQTIYIGGGTPSLIDAKYIEEILRIFEKRNLLKEVKEVTIEVNPGTVTEEKLRNYKNSGVNRLSIGLQSTEDKILKQIGRIHCYDDFLNTYKMARKVGFKNINVDVMIGLPNQKILDVKNSLEKIIKLEPEPPNHISVYSLIVEENTPIEKMLESGELELPDEELERNMYWYVKNFLELNGYKHYEISNFAKLGNESKHNLDCWNQKEYVGFGVAAHSYIDDVRYGNIGNVEEYIKNCENGEFGKNKVIDEVENDIFSKEKEFMLIGLRKIEGVLIQDFKNKFGENPIFVFKDELKKLVDENLLIVDFDRIKLTNKGLDLANIVWENFV
ncbi:MAG: radical SAM family heme chaperone HemW [Clostridia bacterium]|jgi:oxygen-independent coproporphyrinogen-3 oxidase